MSKNILIIAFFVVVIFSLLFAYPIMLYNSEQTVNITISEKWIKSSSNSRQKYLIASEEGEVFENVDEFWYFKYNSSDIYAKLKVGEPYDIKVVGWRIPFLSWYRNIILVE